MHKSLGARINRPHLRAGGAFGPSQDGVGFYRSTRDTATHYYIDRLEKGSFVIETSYRVQQRGVFAGGIATIQCMYAPEFTAHSAAEAVKVR